MSYECLLCGEHYSDQWLLEAHYLIIHNIYQDVEIDDFDETLLDFNAIEQDRQSVIHYAPARPSVIQYASNRTPQSPQAELVAEALEGAVVRHYKISNINNENIDKFLPKSKNVIIETMLQELKRLNYIKFGLVLDTEFVNVENEISQRGFLTRNRSVMATSDIQSIVDECFEELIVKVTEHQGRGSGWSLKKPIHIILRVHKHGYGYRGSSYIPLPEKIANTHTCINVKNEDNKCFYYAMLTRFLLNEPNLHRPNKRYDEVAHNYNFKGLSYPVDVNDIRIFEKNNPTCSVNVFGIDNSNNIYPLKVAQRELLLHTDLLLLQKDDISHYVFIKDFNKLIHKQLTKCNSAIYACKNCFSFTHNKKDKSRWLTEHQLLCNKQNPVRVQLPSTERNKIVFDKYSHHFKVPITLYCDFEAALLPFDSTTNETKNLPLVMKTVQSRRKNVKKLRTVLKENKKKKRVKPRNVQNHKSNQNKYQRHVPYSFCILLKSELSENLLSSFGLSTKPILYRGDNAARKFIDSLYDIARKVERIYEINLPMTPLTVTEEACFSAATECFICHGEFTEADYKVRDHSHIDGKFRGAAHNKCNLNYKLPNFIPVVFHNLSNYDGHFIIPELGRDDGTIQVLATSAEKFISFSKKVGKIKLRFLDSYRFLSESLAKLTMNLTDADLIETRKLVPPNKLDLVKKKGVFPYEYIDSFTKFQETKLPPPAAFYNKLNSEDIDPNDYEHACTVWSELNIKTLGEYSDFYVTLDVAQLCDCMEEFRTTCMSAYGLDPLMSYTLPGFSYQSMLKQTNCTLDLLTDPDMVLMIEDAVRGGLTQSVKRYVKSNNKYLQGYDSTKESIYLTYVDANNLYGWAMSKPLPYGNFKWVDPTTINDILQIPQDGDVGYIFDCDFEYPHQIHDEHYDLPMLAKTQIPPGGKHPKLLLTLENKERYVAHYWTVQQALQLGLKILKIHRVLQFSQSLWLKPYIDSNTSRRAAAKSDFQKDMFKLLNNSIFGKTLENKRKHINIKLVTNAKKLEKLVQKPNFKTSFIINENIVAVAMNKTVVKMDRPLYVGMSILDISKTLMYDFHYNKMVKFYGRKNIGICYMDTDSFIYWINTDDMYKDLRTFPFTDDFDFSDYPPDHPNFDQGKNKKVLGKFKDEAKSIPLEEMVALMSKMYAVKFDGKVIKKAKGVKNHFIKKNIIFDQYKECLFYNKTITATFNTIRSYNHSVYTITSTKKALSSYDDKRKILEDGINTLPYGHYSLSRIDIEG